MNRRPPALYVAPTTYFGVIEFISRRDTRSFTIHIHSYIYVLAEPTNKITDEHKKVDSNRGYVRKLFGGDRDTLSFNFL